VTKPDNKIPTAEIKHPTCWTAALYSGYLVIEGVIKIADMYLVLAYQWMSHDREKESYMSPLCTVAARVSINAFSGPGNSVERQYSVKIPIEKV
jgi:hypothetical protein